MAGAIKSRAGDVRLIEFPCHRRDNGALVVAEAATGLPFAIQRMFTITAPPGAERGRHAHRLCSQLMMCVQGAVDVVCDDGADHRNYTLDRGEVGLLVPPMIWATLAFRGPESVLVVLCDRAYEATDYIHDYSEYLSLRKAIDG
jgi:dTDP-4-dehydrorhamnose 3,5-epimerase-like enzyme